MRTNPFRRFILAMLLFTLLCPAGDLALWAQTKDKQPPPPPPPEQAPGGYSISVTVPVVSVDVVVTDNNGNYLTGLKKENFRITEDGTVQAITNFAPDRRAHYHRAAAGIQQAGLSDFFRERRQLGRRFPGQSQENAIGWRWKHSTCVPTWTSISRIMETK